MSETLLFETMNNVKSVEEVCCKLLSVHYGYNTFRRTLASMLPNGLCANTLAIIYGVKLQKHAYLVDEFAFDDFQLAMYAARKLPSNEKKKKKCAILPKAVNELIFMYMIRESVVNFMRGEQKKKTTIETPVFKHGYEPPARLIQAQNRIGDIHQHDWFSTPKKGIGYFDEEENSKLKKKAREAENKAKSHRRK